MAEEQKRYRLKSFTHFLNKKQVFVIVRICNTKKELWKPIEEFKWLDATKEEMDDEALPKVSFDEHFKNWLI